MADSRKPERPRPGDSPPGGDDDVYGLADGDSTDLDAGGPPPDLLTSDAEGPELHEAEPQGPRAASAPEAPLPRLWKAEPEPDERPVRGRGKDKAPEKDDKAKDRDKERPAGKPEASRPARRESTRQKDSRPGGIERIGTVTKQSNKEAARAERKPARRQESRDEKEKKGEGVLIEETPELDTIETRKTVRIVVGVVAFLVCAATGFIILKSLSPGQIGQEEPVAEAPAAPAGPVVARGPAPPNREAIEHEARVLFDRARETARRGKTGEAIAMLTTITKSYPNTKAAKEAKEALDRPSHNLPLFLSGPAVLATAPETKAAALAPMPNVVEATPELAPKATSGEVGLVRPSNPAESSGGGTPAVAEAVGRPLPQGFRPRPGTRVHASGWALEIVGDRDGAPMVLVPGGAFTMGRDDAEPEARPAHAVKVSTFYIDQHEVTVHQFDLYQKEAGRRPDRDRALAREPAAAAAAASEDSPVGMVDLKEAKDYASWAGKRIPTEAQWEMAARGPDQRLYPWGSQPPDWGKKREPRKIVPVMSFTNDVSPFGAFDMAGNAWEWTQDWFDPRYYYLFKGQTAADPTGPSRRPPTQQLAVRGCSKNWTVTAREGVKGERRFPFLGFRCVLPVEGPNNAFEAAAKGKAAPAANPGQPAGPPPGTPPPF